MLESAYVPSQPLRVSSFWPTGSFSGERGKLIHTVIGGIS